MRDYKNQTSRPPAKEIRQPLPRKPVEQPEEDFDDEEADTPSGQEQQPRRWPWMLLVAIILMSAGIWWWIAQLPINNGQLGLTTGNPVTATASTTRTASTRSSTDVNSGAASTANTSPEKPLALAPTSLATSTANYSKTQLSGSATTRPTAATASVRSGVDFNFYQILPKMQVDIPADILGSGPGIPAAPTNSSAAVHQPVTIQVGAFTNRAAAVVLRDRLALLGVSTHMEKAENADSNQLYRLQTNTFDSLSEAQPTLTKIRGMGITPMLIGSDIMGSEANAPLSQSPTP